MFVRAIPYFLTAFFYKDITKIVKEVIGPTSKVALENVDSTNLLHFVLSAIPPAMDQVSGVVSIIAITGGTAIIFRDSVRLMFRPYRVTPTIDASDVASIMGGAPSVKYALEGMESNKWDKWEKKIPTEQIPIFTHLKKLVQGLQTMDLTSEQIIEVDSLVTNLDETIALYDKGHSISKTLQSDDYELQKTLESQLHVLTQAATELATIINKEQLSSLQAHSLFLNERYQPLQLDKPVNLKKS
jgi:hypothetical protein